MDIKSSTKHDLLAPLCNIRAFNEELRHVAQILDSFAESQAETPRQEISDTCKQLANDDILMCTDAITRASDMLEEKITELLQSTAESN